MTVQQSLDRCSFCPNLCRQSCPVADADQDQMSLPGNKVATMKLLNSRKLTWSKEAALQAYKCSHCGNSTETCELDNPVASVLDQFRAKAFRKGLAPDSVYKYCKKFKERNNPYGIRLLPQLKKKVPAERFHPAGVTYFPGCTEIARQPQSLQHTLQLFDKLKVSSFGVFDQQIQCCGYPLLAAGDIAGFKEHAEVLSHMMADYPLIVSGAPACVFTMKALYPAYGFPMAAEIQSLPEFLVGQFSESNFHVKKGVQSKVSYHDPCYLGRYLQVYEQPRQLLRTVIGHDPIEFSRCRNQSYCSGGGGLLPVSRPETAKTITETRLREFKETGAKVLVTSCGTCVNRFKRHGNKIQVSNLTDFLNRAIVPESGDKIKDELGE